MPKTWMRIMSAYITERQPMTKLSLTIALSKSYFSSKTRSSSLDWPPNFHWSWIAIGTLIFPDGLRSHNRRSLASIMLCFWRALRLPSSSSFSSVPACPGEAAAEPVASCRRSCHQYLECLGSLTYSVCLICHDFTIVDGVINQLRTRATLILGSYRDSFHWAYLQSGKLSTF